MKKLLTFLTIPAFFLSFFAGVTFAKGIPTDNPNIPEVPGVYQDPDHPGIFVRVFVHYGNHGKPNPKPDPTLQCSLDDTDSNSVVGSAGWKLPQSWIYNLNPSSVPSSVGSSNLPTFAGIGFSKWSDAIGYKVNFEQGVDTTTSRQAYDGQNIITWGRTNGSALAVTYIRYTSSGDVVDVDTIMNQKFTWSWADQSTNALCAYSDTYDAQDILTHELGHWIGLDDEYSSNYSNNTMYGYGSMTEIKKDTLTTGDVAGASAIY
jgi:hypothetical protein